MPDNKPSRQRQWQLKQKELGRCEKCGLKAVNKTHCEKHRDAQRKVCNRYYKKKKKAGLH